MSDDGATATDPVARPSSPPGPVVPPPPSGPPVPGPTAPASGGRAKVFGIGVVGVLLVAAIGAYVLFAGSEDDSGSGDASPATSEPSGGLAGAIAPVIEDIGLGGDDCALLAEDTESVVADLGAVTSISSGLGELVVDEGPIAAAYCNLGTERGLVSVSAAVTDLAAVHYLDQYYAALDPAPEGELSGQGYDPALAADDTGSIAGTCLTDSPQYEDQCRYAWSDGTVVLQFADVGADLEPGEGFALLDRYVASALDRFGG